MGIRARCTPTFPRRLNAMLTGGALDLSPISAFALGQHADELVLLPDLCIGARDEVVSVVLVSQTPPALLDGVTDRIDQRIRQRAQPAARAARTALRSASRSYLDSDRPLEVAAQGKPALFIGDSAIDALERFPREHVYDLGTAVARMDRPANGIRGLGGAARCLRARSRGDARMHACAYR